MLWACLYLPDLAFHAAFDGLDDTHPRALVDGPVQRRRIVTADAAAREAGVRGGQSLAAARVLCPALHVRPRLSAHESRLLEEVAVQAYRFSDRVAPAPPQSLLLEVGASLKLFGGWRALQGRLRDSLADLGLDLHLAAAPTAAAAWLLARHQDGLCLPRSAALYSALGQLPLQRCGLPVAQARALGGMGFRHLRELFRLPRPELQRRIGADGMLWLDRLRGQAPETVKAWHPPDRFEHRVEFDFEVHGGSALLFALRRQTAALARHLVARDGGVQHFELVLEHDRDARTRIPVTLARPQRDATMLFDLARTRLERVELPAAVRALHVEARQLPAFHPGERDLFDRVRGDGLDWPDLCQRLAARFGPEALRQLASVAEHRPERAWRTATESDHQAACERRPRPLWLLRRPCPLRGPIRVLGGPERLESGWWDGADMRRDYYVVQTGHGQRAWAYRAAGSTEGWMLHGWFA